MPNYRRIRMKGGCYFFTVVTESRQHILTSNIELLRYAFRKAMVKYPFRIDGFVVLPDHLHCIWTLPDHDDDYAIRWRLIKNYFSRGLKKGEYVESNRCKRGGRGIWQRRFWEHLIQHEKDYQRHLDYIHYNPVKHGYVARPGDWPYTSFHKCVRRGLYEMDWASPVDSRMECE